MSRIILIKRPRRKIHKLPVGIVAQIQDLAQSEELFKDQGDLGAEISKLDNLVLEAFGLQHNPFIEYTLNIMIPQIVHAKHPERLQYQSVTKNE